METSAPVAQQFKYRAFISYSHHDRGTAQWLQRALEGYRVPKELVGTPGLDGPVPRQLFPVFRDRCDLRTSPNLSASIREALAESANLVVLCSPAAAQSGWVNQEVTLFKQLGRSDRIHALIVDGKPEASPADGGCFPAALRFKLGANGEVDLSQREERIAADLRPEGDGKEDAKLKVIAGLLGVAFNALRQRERIAARRRLRTTQAIAASILVLALAAGVFGWSTWYFSRQSDELQIPGLRVAKHVTTLDLSGWQETTPADIAGRVKKSLALSTDNYTLVKTQAYAGNYVHIVGTSSPIPPEVICQRCQVIARTPDAASRTTNEFKVVFDISKAGLEESVDIDYSIKYWNAFQTPDQWWGGVRILYQTESVQYTIIFPPSKHPSAEKISYYYFDTKEHPLQAGTDVSLEKDDNGRVAKLTWRILFPSTDRSYRVRWDWSDAPTTNTNGSGR